MATAKLFRCGLASGLLAGCASGLFGLAFGEGLIERASLLEAGRSAPAEVFSRTAQRWGLLGATALYGLAVGGLFGFAFAFLAPRLRRGSTAERSRRLAAACFVCLWLVPSLEYPANPPGAGDPSTIGGRTALYLAAVGISLGAALSAWAVLHRLEDLGVPPGIRRVLGVGGYAAAIGLAYGLLPAGPASPHVPPGLLRDFRLASVAMQGILWAVLGASFGRLASRCGARAPATPAAERG
jgi:hypothetical protein